MFSKKFRLPITENKTGLKRVYSSPYFLLKSRENEEDHNRFAIIISVDAAGKSVRRHYWRRQIAEYLKNWPNFKKDFLIIVSPKIESADKKVLQNELEKTKLMLSK